MNFKDRGVNYRYTESCMLSDSLRRENKNNYILLIKIVFNNRFADCETFDKKLEEFFGVKNYNKKFNEMIEGIKRDHNADKGRILKEIKTYQFTKKMNIEPAKTQLEEKLKSYPEFAYNITATKKVETSNTKKFEKMNEQLHEDVKIILNSDKSIEELQDSKEIITKDLIQKIRTHAREFSDEELVNILIKNRNVEKISEEELDQYIEVLQYFINNIKLNISKLFDVEFDEEKMRKFYVVGEENLNKNITDYSNKLFFWKLQKLQSILRFYEEMLDIYCKFRETLCVEDITPKLNFQTRNYVKEDTPFIYEHYQNLQLIKKVYTSIDKLNVNDDKLKSLKDEYHNTLVLRNNK